MPLYEHVFIARQDISAQHVDDLAGQFSEIVTKSGGKVTKTEPWGLRTLAYKINKNRKGHYVLLNIDGPHEAVQELERIQKLNDDILRYLTLRVDELEDEPSILIRSRGSRDGRPPHRSDDGGRARRDDRPGETKADAGKSETKADAGKSETKADAGKSETTEPVKEPDLKNQADDSTLPVKSSPPDKPVEPSAPDKGDAS